MSFVSFLIESSLQIYRDETDGSRWSGLGAEPAGECGYCGGGALLGARGAVFTSAPINEAPRGAAWRHAVRLAGDSRLTLTQGNYEVTQLVGWDERRQLL